MIKIRPLSSKIGFAKCWPLPDADAAFVGRLRSQLLEKSPVITSRRFSPRLAWAFAIVLVLLIAGLLAFSPQVVQAMRRLLGYIPGLGYVEKAATLRVLSAPVTVQQDGLTVTIDNGLADAQRTVLLARVEGYPAGRSGPPTCKDAPRPVSADGTVRAVVSIAGRSDPQNDAMLLVRYEFQAMPAKSMDATLEIPCLMFDAEYRGWSIPLHFQTADATSQVIPVIELPTSIPTQPVPPGTSTSASESAPAGFTIVLKNVSELDDGYVLAGSYQWSDVNTDQSAVVVSDSDMIDANGQPVQYQEVEPDPSADFEPSADPICLPCHG